MRVIIIIVTFSLLSLTITLAQNYQGIVLDSTNGVAIPYVNIGIVGKNVGTVTNEKGYFSIILDADKFYYDTIRFSIVGYQSISFQVHEFLNSKFKTDNRIFLSPKSTLLQEIIISASSASGLILGNKPKSKYANAGFINNKLGHEIGSLFKVKNSPILLDSVQLDSIQLNFVKCNYEKIFLRLNVYRVIDRKEENVLHEPIYISLSKSEILARPIIDLSMYNILINSDFIVSVEIVKDLGEKGLYFYASMQSETYPALFRETSQSSWRFLTHKSKPAGISILAFVH